MWGCGRWITQIKQFQSGYVFASKESKHRASGFAVHSTPSWDLATSRWDVDYPEHLTDVSEVMAFRHADSLHIKRKQGRQGLKNADLITSAGLTKCYGAP
jgi:hypothetical protein